ncbi:response regulator transcription factor [Chloroflexota bacterium]
MSSDSIRLLVVEADTNRGAIYEDTLARMRGVELVDIVHNRRAALQRAKDIQPDVLLVDLMLPGYRSIDVIEQVTNTQPQVRTLALSPADPPHDRVILAVRAGALGYVCRDDSPSELATAIQRVHQGELWLPPDATYEVLKDVAPELGVSAEERRNRLTAVILGILPLSGLIAALTALLWRKYWGHVGVRVTDLGVDPSTRVTDVFVAFLVLLGVFGPLLFVDRWLQIIGEWIETKPALSGTIARVRGLYLGRLPIGRLIFNRLNAWAGVATLVVLSGLLLARYADLVLILLVGPAVGIALLASMLGLDDILPRFLQRGRLTRPVLAMLLVLIVLFLVVLGAEVWIRGPDLQTDGMHGLLAPSMLGLTARPMVLYDLDGNLEPLGALYLGGNADLYVLYDPCAETVRLVPVGSSRVEMVDQISCGSR